MSLVSGLSLFNVSYELNPTAVEPLQSPRQPQGIDAIYLLTPTSQNVNRIIADFDGRRTYRSAHLYFIDGMRVSLERHT